jgi:DNA-binding IclR family transcriptional regulator
LKKTNSQDRLLALLDLFSLSRPLWTPDELMRELGYSRPTLYRYLKSLRDIGLLMSTRGGQFTLGPRVMEMDYLSRHADPLVAAASSHLNRLTTARACTAQIVRWYGDRMLCVTSQSSAPDPIGSYPRGQAVLMGRGAIGRSIMAFLPKLQVMPLIEHHAKDLREVGFGASTDEILVALKRIKRAGIAVAFGEMTPGAVDIAAPILEASYPVASLCMTIGGQHARRDLIDHIGEEVRNAARLIAVEAFEPGGLTKPS